MIGALGQADQLERLMRIERLWIVERGLPGRPWYRSLYAAPDPTNGYGGWMLPALRYAVEHDDVAHAVEQNGPDFAELIVLGAELSFSGRRPERTWVKVDWDTLKRSGRPVGPVI